MDDALLVGEFQCAGNRREEPGCLRPGDGCSDALFQRPRGDVIHHQVGNPILVAVVIDVNDVGMSQLCQGERFAFESLQKLVIVHALGADHLERHRPLQPRIEGFVDDRHAALAKLLDDVVAPQGLTDQIWHIAVLTFSVQGNYSGRGR